MTGAVAAMGGVAIVDLSGFSSQLVGGNSGSNPAVWSMLNTGQIADYFGASPSYWLRNGSAANYDVYATVTTGTLSSGTTGSWLNMGTTRTWQKNSGADCAVQLDLRDAFSLSVVKTITITLSPAS